MTLISISDPVKAKRVLSHLEANYQPYSPSDTQDPPHEGFSSAAGTGTYNGYLPIN